MEGGSSCARWEFFNDLVEKADIELIEWIAETFCEDLRSGDSGSHEVLGDEVGIAEVFAISNDPISDDSKFESILKSEVQKAEFLSACHNRCYSSN
jgi:hypothetical protein